MNNIDNYPNIQNPLNHESPNKTAFSLNRVWTIIQSGQFNEIDYNSIIKYIDNLLDKDKQQPWEYEYAYNGFALEDLKLRVNEFKKTMDSDLRIKDEETFKGVFNNQTNYIKMEIDFLIKHKAERPIDLEKIEQLKNGYQLDENGIVTIVFNQNEIISEAKKIKELNKFILKFDGLCELICNKILVSNLLGKSDKKNNELKKEITLQSLNKESIIKSHLLYIYSFFELSYAFIFGIFPDNILSKEDQRKLVKKGIISSNLRINRDVFDISLDNLEQNAILKVEIFRRRTFSFYGHSVLIKKTGENEFIFFDPNSGEKRGLNKNQLAEEINDQLSKFNGTDVLMLNTKNYLTRLKSKGIA